MKEIKENKILKLQKYIGSYITEEEYMEYKNYLDKHIDNVNKAYQIIKDKLPHLISGHDLDEQFAAHDLSKYNTDEFLDYAIYFYRKDARDTKIAKEMFDEAWLHHQRRNPHHHQYWVLLKDDGTLKPLDMPYHYIVEMICDWWSFSFSKKNLREIEAWYNENKNKMVLSENTRKTVENIIQQIVAIVDDIPLFEYI